MCLLSTPHLWSDFTETKALTFSPRGWSGLFKLRLFFNCAHFGGIIDNPSAQHKFSILVPIPSYLSCPPSPNFYDSINILTSISAVFLKFLKYTPMSPFHQLERYIWKTHITRWQCASIPLPLPLQALAASALPRQGPGSCLLFPNLNYILCLVSWFTPAFENQ